MDGEVTLDLRILDILERLGSGEDLYQFSLAAPAGLRHDSADGRRLIAARTHLRSHFTAAGMATLVIPFDRQHDNPLATLTENLLFGVPPDPALTGRPLAAEPRFRSVLAKLGLLDDLAGMGVAIGRNLVDIFRDVPPGHPLFRRFSAISPEDLPEYERRLVGIVPGTTLTLGIHTSVRSPISLMKRAFPSACGAAGFAQPRRGLVLSKDRAEDGIRVQAWSATGLPLLEGEGWGEVWSISGEVTHLTLSLSFQERGLEPSARCAHSVARGERGRSHPLGHQPGPAYRLGFCSFTTVLFGRPIGLSGAFASNAMRAMS